MRTNDYIIRITYDSFSRIRKLYPAFEKESMAGYFERLSKWLEQMKQNDI